SMIKSLFEGSATDRGILAAYNLQDCDLVMDLFFHCSVWPKMINVCRVNSVPMSTLWTRGQQLRVFGGFYKHAMNDNYFIYRPHYHPILDLPIVEDETLMSKETKEERSKSEKHFEK